MSPINILFIFISFSMLQCNKAVYNALAGCALKTPSLQIKQTAQNTKKEIIFIFYFYFSQRTSARTVHSNSFNSTINHYASAALNLPLKDFNGSI